MEHIVCVRGLADVWLDSNHEFNLTGRSQKDAIVALQIDRPAGDSFEYRALGTPEMRNDHHSSALANERAQCRQRRPHAAIISDLTVFQWHIQIETNDDSLAVERTQRFDCAKGHCEPRIRGVQRRTR